MPRTRILTPPTTNSTIVFPSYGRPGKFFINAYSPDMTEDRLSRDNLVEFFKRMNAESAAYSQNQRVASCCTVLLLLAEILGPLFVSLHYDFDFKNEWKCMWIAILIFTIVISVVITNGITRKTKKTCQELISKQNEALRSQGLRWNLPDEFPAWIELCKDYKTQNYANQSGLFPLGEHEAIDMDIEMQSQSPQKQKRQVQSKSYVPISEEKYGRNE